MHTGYNIFHHIVPGSRDHHSSLRSSNGSWSDN